MLTKRQLVALMDRRVVRRMVIVPIALLVALVGVICSPLILIITTLSDLVARRKRLPRLRLAILLLGALVIETLGMIASLITWLLTGFGFLGSPRWRWHLHRGYMGRYTMAMLRLIARVIGAPIDWRDNADLSSGPVVMAARHTSFFDSLIPASVLSRRNKLLAHHVVTHGLRYAPCIDIVGHRFPNRFIKRTPGHGSNELSHIAQVGSELDARSAAIIFPEGTFRNPERFERAVRRLRRQQPELAERASNLDHVLPPRASGTLALLEGAPTADLVLCMNTGLESFGSLRAIIDKPFSSRPIVIETRRIPRADIPMEPVAFSEWLFEQYETIDAWVHKTQVDQISRS